MAKQITVEIIIRGDIIENNVLAKFASKLKEQKFTADFVTTVAIPPFLVASERRYPSLAVMYTMVDLENKFQLKKVLDELTEEEKLDIISFKQL
ncbi:MAG: hypothetical protein NWF07_07225 [Candidatus Bathyarchaeota archaeon]|nr:hypothetical protein [Candidatus Bathyarchaeota archaeon]